MNEILDYISALIKEYTKIDKIYISSIKDFQDEKDSAEIQIVNTENTYSFKRVLWTDLELNIVFRVKNETKIIQSIERLNNLFLKRIHLNNYTIVQILSDSVKFNDIDEKLNYIYTVTLRIKYNKK